jgi:hypothetical protein
VVLPWVGGCVCSGGVQGGLTSGVSYEARRLEARLVQRPLHNAFVHGIQARHPAYASTVRYASPRLLAHVFSRSPHPPWQHRQALAPQPYVSSLPSHACPRHPSFAPPCCPMGCALHWRGGGQMGMVLLSGVQTCSAQRCARRRWSCW